MTRAGLLRSLALTGLSSILLFTAVLAGAATLDGSAALSDARDTAQATPSPKAYEVGGALDVSGAISYSISNTNRTLNLKVAQLSNNSTTATSGSIKLMAFLTTAPIGTSFSYWIVGETQLNALLPNYAYNNIDTTVPLNSAPDGIYYIHIGAFEYEGSCGSSSGYCLDDYVTFNNLVRVTGGNYTAVSTTVTSVEYFHAGFGHYFVTAVADEISALDSGAFQGWARTGQTFKVWTLDASGRVAVCRFFTTAFAPRSSHFYTPFADECAFVRNNPVWQYEGIVAFVQLPTPGGVCDGAIPLYRLYNNGVTGAPNHRYTTSLSIRSQMMAQGWIPEGAGGLGVIACVPV